MIKKLQKKYALSEQGAKDLIKGCLACVLQNLSFMFPVGLLYYLVSDLMNGGVPGGKIPFYVAGCVVCIGLILLTTFFQYNATYFATYKKAVSAALPWQSICAKSLFLFSEKRI